MAATGLNQIVMVGHSTRSFCDVLGMLRQNDVTSLADARRFPASGKFPHWDQPAIIGASPDDIDYRWVLNLGGRRHTPAGQASENGAWRVKAFRDYADYMATGAFEAGLGELLDIATRRRPAIMCSEAVPWPCHRRLIADALIAAGAEVCHIMSATTTTPASLNEPARLTDGRITYPPPP